MHYSSLIGLSLLTSSLCSPLRPHHHRVTVDEWFTKWVTVTTRVWNHDHRTHNASLSGGSSTTHEPTSHPTTGVSAVTTLLTTTALNSTATPLETPAGSSVLTTDGASSTHTIDTVVPVSPTAATMVPTTHKTPSPWNVPVVSASSAAATSSPLGPVSSKAVSSAQATTKAPSNGGATVFPSTSPVPTLAPGVTLYANSTGLPMTPTVGPGGSPPAPSATTQTYVDRCKSPSAELPPLAMPTGDSLADWFLYYHNVHRRNHSAPDMIWSLELEKDAATLFGEYATEGKSGHIMGINGDSYGQNLAGASGWKSWPATTYGDYVVSNQQAANGSAAMWYHEGDNLSDAVWAQIKAQTTNSHFTQMVSPHSTLLGCAVEQQGWTSANGQSSGYSVACNYGNNNLPDTPVSEGLCQPQVD